MVPLKCRLANDVAPPHAHGRKHREASDDQKGPAVAVHVEDAARSDQTGGNCSEQRPDARGDEMIGMLRRGVRFAHGLGLGSINLWKLAAIEVPRMRSQASRAPETSYRTM